MKKILGGLLMIVLAVILAACGTTTNTSPVTTTSTSSTNVSSTSNPPTNVSPTEPEPTLTTTPTSLPNPQVTRITADDLKQLLDNKTDIVLVDSRDANTFNKGHIKGAINIPSYPGGQPLFNQLKTLPQGKLIVFYCSWADDAIAASMAAAMPGLKDDSGNSLGYDLNNIRVLRAGWEYWKTLNAWWPSAYPIAKES